MERKIAGEVAARILAPDCRVHLAVQFAQPPDLALRQPGRRGFGGGTFQNGLDLEQIGGAGRGDGEK